VVLKFVSGRILLFLKLKWEAHLDTLVDWLLTASSSARSWQQAQELISGLCLGARVRFLPSLTGLNPGLLDSAPCRRCGAEEETSAHILHECEALASLRHAYLGSFLLEPENIKSISLGAI